MNLSVRSFIHHFTPLNLAIGFLCSSSVILNLQLTYQQIPPTFLWVIWTALVFCFAILADRFRRNTLPFIPPGRATIAILCVCVLFASVIAWSSPLPVPAIRQNHTLTLIFGDNTTRQLNGTVILKKLSIGGVDVPLKDFDPSTKKNFVDTKFGLEATDFAILQMDFSGSWKSEIKAVFYSGPDAGTAALLIDGLRSTTRNLKDEKILSVSPEPSLAERSIKILAMFLNGLGIATLLIMIVSFLFRHEGFLSRNNSAILCALILICLALLFFQGLNLGMEARFSGYDEEYNLPIAISRLYFGNSGYSYLCALAPFNIEILQTHRVPPITNTQRCVSAETDKGGADFATLSLRLFGLHIESIYYTWFVVFGLSLLLFMLSFYRRPDSLFLLLLLVLSIDTVFFVYGFSPHLGSLPDTRTMGLISSAAFLHLALLTLGSQPLNLWRRLAVIPQVVLILFAVFCRISVAYQILCLLLLAAGVGLFQMNMGRAVLKSAAEQITHTAFFRHNGFPALALLAGLILSLGLQEIQLKNTVQSDQINHHNLWHNMGIGMGFNPELADRYELTTGELTADAAMLHLVNRRVISLNPRADWLSWDKKEYEAAARETVIQIAFRNPQELVELFFYYKPRFFLKTFLSTTPFIRHSPGFSKYAYNPLRIEVILILFPALLALGGSGIAKNGGFNPRPAVLIALALFLFSCLPWMLAYPLLHVIPESLVFLTLLFFTLASAALLRMSS